MCSDSSVLKRGVFVRHGSFSKTTGACHGVTTEFLTIDQDHLKWPPSFDRSALTPLEKGLALAAKCSSKLQEKDERQKHPYSTNLCAFRRQLKIVIYLILNFFSDSNILKTLDTIDTIAKDQSSHLVYLNICTK